MLPIMTLALAMAAPPEPFEFKDGDRIVWLGGTQVEREQQNGYWETALLRANRDKKLTIRNLGWSGDTVYGDSRAAFDTAEKGFERLVKLTLELKPTVLMINYGSNESFDGLEGLPRFEKGYAKLIEALKPSKARIVLFAPQPYVDEFLRKDKDLISKYQEVVKNTAYRHDCRFIDLAKRIDERGNGAQTFVSPPASLNGMHMTDAGYKNTMYNFLESLGQRSFHDFSSDKDPLTPQEIESLRQAVIAKNELFFHRWRPQNETYLFGFRKHEQGKNAKEIVEFDPLISKAEDEIQKILNKK